MADFDRLSAENEMLRSRLAGLTEAILRISEDLDLDVVLQQVVDGARILTGARYGAITTMDDAGELQDVLFSGLSPEDEQMVVGYERGIELFGYLSGMDEPLRTSNFVEHVESVGFDGFQPYIGAFLGAQIKVRDRQVGTMFVGEKHDGSEFAHEDEEAVEMFASQAAMALTNARRYGDEQRAKADLQALVNTSPVGVVIVDAASRDVLMANREARRLLGIGQGQEYLSLASFAQLSYKRMDGSETSIEDLPFEQALLADEPVQAEELVIVRPDGSEVATLVNTAAIRSDGGELTTIIATIQDASPLEDLERLRAEFLAVASHELRAPLTAIKGSAATVLDSRVPPDAAEVRQFFRIVEERADHMRDLINDLLDMTRIEAGTLSVTTEPADLASIVDHAKSAFLSGGHPHHVKIDLFPNLPRVWADRQRIAQVLHNLFSNAAASSHEWSTITVEASLDDTHVAVSVTDEGAGIAPERLPLLFTKFPRARDEHETRPGTGYGLGLAICKGIVEAHGGRIWAHSAGHNRGAQFTFTVPVLDEPAAIAGVADPDLGAGARGPAKVERILVVEDDPQTLRYTRNTLARAGYTPIVTDDPNELDHLLDTEMPHLALLDLMLPGADAFELIRRSPKVLEIPVIIVSGRGDDQLVAKAFELGAADYIVKPFSPTELLARIAAALRRRAQSRHAEPYRLADLTVDYMTHSVTVAGNAVNLTPTEYKLLSELCINAGRDLSYEQLLEAVWGDGASGDAQRVRTFVKDLRAKLGDRARKPTYILTVPNVGYRAATP
ncbi:ATP-binding protein [Candidatus Poriferisodalis sp.]|uniref:hybrid sensor histidine kinase/response regulator n=1 Tax=Candidatus Poriferisodalis sp. TaxID=3101277 RepID=UPI003B01C5F4